MSTTQQADVKPRSKLLCVGGPWDGTVTEDIGPYLRVTKEREFDPLAPLMSKTFEFIVYVRIKYRRRDGGVLYVYEAEGTDSMMELWEHYLKTKARK